VNNAGAYAPSKKKVEERVMILRYNDGQAYRLKIDALKQFGIIREAYMPAVFKDLPGGNNWIVLIHGPKKNDKGGWMPHKTNADWLNQPIDGDWNYFTQLQLTGDPLEHAATRIKDRADEKNQAIFIKEEDEGPNKGNYFFYGVYKSELISKESGICVFHRIATTLETNDWVK
jgi:hypothetical protein